MRRYKSKCPYCERVFTARSNQIFCNNKHGSSYRNRIRRHPDIDFQIEHLAILDHIKKLSSMCAGDIAHMSKKEFEMLQIGSGLFEAQLTQAEYAKLIGGNDGGSFEEIGGFIIHTVDDWVYIYPPGWQPQNRSKTDNNTK